MSAAEQMTISAQQAAIAAGNAVLRGEGDGTYSEAQDAIRLLIAALEMPLAATLRAEVLRWCDHVERFAYTRDGAGGQLDASPHLLAGYARKLAMLTAGQDGTAELECSP